ncbi:MAG: ABC transporter substrate-binding protein [Phycisphaerales bacterium]|nr:ABC transporter substrate-binding protein [Phycisphaerales bacterium]
MRAIVAKVMLWLGAIVLAAVVSGCGREPSKSGATGSETTPTRELRIVAHSPALAVILKDLGYEAQIVGRHAYDLVLDPKVPSCGELGTIDYETLIRVRPTHVFIQWGARELPERLTELAKANDWVVMNLNPLGLDEIESCARQMDEAVFAWTVGEEKKEEGTPGPGRPRPREHVKPPMPFEEEMKRAWRDRGAGMKRAGRILILGSAKPLGAMGPGSFHHQLLEQLGGVPALGAGGDDKFKAAWVTLDLEDLQKLAPDGIVIFSPRPPRTAEPEKQPTAEELIALMGRAAELNVPAIKNKRVAVIDDPLGLTPSTAMIGVADELAGIVLAWGEENAEGAERAEGRGGKN